ncbi:MAG: shikimate kinase [Bdellovibrionales bacterium]
MKLTFIVGHRGVGKSSLLKRWKHYQPQNLYFDLDSEIEKNTGLSIDEIFSQLGESAFREIEKKVLNKIIFESAQSLVIACGAGFPIQELPANAKVIFVKRDSDSRGRIFLDRPRLNPDLNPIEEFHHRRLKREPLFMKRADFIYTMPEGLKDADEVEKSILLGKAELEALVTLMPGQPPSKIKGAVYEWRSDLLSMEEFLKLGLESHEVLYSVRDDKELPDLVNQSQISLDWDVCRPLPNNTNIKIISTHENNIEKATQAVSPFLNGNYLIKLCPQVNSWSELLRGWLWQKEDPKHRSFLPRSADGRWSWFRIFMKGKQKINFFREGHGSSLDQPTLWEWLNSPVATDNKFAAVLGDPVEHSYSPVFHKQEFKKLNQTFLKIRISQSDWTDALGVLFQMGLRKAAVTSPLKSLAGQLAQSKEPLNTLALDENRNTWMGTNTDFPALAEILKDYKSSKSVVIWGGGGLLPSIQKCLPLALPYSARTGEPRLRVGSDIQPEILVWAAGQSNIQQVPNSWQPKLVLDMSYVDNSAGLALAQLKKSKYVSGLELFEKQALLQQKWWMNYK